MTTTNMHAKAITMFNVAFNAGYATRKGDFVAMSKSGNYVVSVNTFKFGKGFCKSSFTFPAQLVECEGVFDLLFARVKLFNRDNNQDRSERLRANLTRKEFVPECPKSHGDKGMIEFFSTMAYMASCNWSSIMDTYDSCSSYDCVRNLQFVEGMICPLIDPVEDQSAGDLSVVYQNIIKESLATDGYSALSVDDCVFHITRGGEKYMCENPKKAIARYSKLAKTPTATSIGRKSVFVCSYVPEGLHEWLYLGSTLCSADLIRQYGTFRCVSKDGLKCMTSIAPEGFLPEGVDMVACSNSYKSGLNGIAYHALMDVMGDEGQVFDTLINLSVEQIAEVAGLKAATIEFGEYKLEGYLINPELNVTTFNMLSGLSATDGESSVYQEALALIAENPDFNLVDYVYALETAGIVKYKSPRVNIKGATMELVYWSYGPEIATAYTESVFRRMMGLSHDAPLTGYDINDFLNEDLFEQEIVADQA